MFGPIVRLTAAVLLIAGAAGAATVGGTARMVARLAEILEEMKAQPGMFDSHWRAEQMLEQEAAGGRSRPGQALVVARELLRAGRTQEALARLQKLKAETMKAPGANPEVVKNIRFTLAIAWLRSGEEQNCVARHGPDSCLFPIRGTGVHTVQEGSRGAVKELEEFVRDYGEDWAARWLINVAYMTLGEYPHKVPPQYLVSPERLESPSPLKRFQDVAPALGLTYLGHPGSVVMDDLDADGDLDLMVTANQLVEQTMLFRNDAGKFTDVTRDSGLAGITGIFNMVQADFDNDGDRDVLGLRGGWRMNRGHFPVSLLRNDGQMRFSDITEEAGLLDLFPTQTAAWGDFDDDGWLDLYLGEESSCPGHEHLSKLFRNNRNGTFTPLPDSAGATVKGIVKAALWGDVDDDGRLDLYLSRWGDTNVLLRNAGPDGAGGWKFEDRSAQAGVQQPIFCFPACLWDYDNDGRLDIFVEGYGPRTDELGPRPVGQLMELIMDAMAENSLATSEVARSYAGVPFAWDPGRLYRNRGDGTFEDATAAAGLAQIRAGMSLNFGDLDADGDLELYLGTGAPTFGALIPNRLYLNEGGKRFREITTGTGVGHLQKGHGISIGDIDRDGDLDIFARMGGAMHADVARCALYQNPGTGNQWARLKLRGKRVNRDAIGARIRVRAGGRDVHATVGSGGSFGASPLEQFIGLGGAASMDEVEIRWPGPEKRTTLLRNLPAGREHVIEEP